MITCPICDKHFKQLTNKHLSLHNMTTHDFKSQFPNHPLVDQDVLEKNQTNRKIGKQSSVIKQKQNKKIAKHLICYIPLYVRNVAVRCHILIDITNSVIDHVLRYTPINTVIILCLMQQNNKYQQR